MATASTLYFGSYRLDIDESRLTRDGAPVALRPKAFDLLAALAVRPNELVTKDELLDRVWGRRFITEGVIKSIVGELRSALGDDAKQPQWIETVPRRGYRFVGPVHRDPFDVASVPVATTADGNVPQSLPAPVGRADSLATVEVLHVAHRLVTICGPSGVGKTRLALALAGSRRAAWRDGVWFVELASLAADATDGPALCATVAQALRLDAAAGRDAASLARALRPLEMLLVLDNAEHVVEPVSRLVCTLLSATPSLRIVVTSQEPLRTPEEQVYRLAPLTLPVAADDVDEQRLMASSAVQLFVQRVSARVQGFALAPQQQQAVAAICRALDGVPLALELAAARVPLLGVHGIADLLLGDESDARLQLLTVGARTAAPRQATLRNAIEWSYRLLDVPQRTLFRRLGVFRGGVSLRVAQAVCSGDDLCAWSVLDGVDALVDKSLVESYEAAGERRFRLLESLRAYALERLTEEGEDHATGERQLQAMRAYWSAADDRALEEPSLAWIERHVIEIDNLRAALRWADRHGDGDALVGLMANSALLWCRAGFGIEGRTWCERARPAAERSGDASLRGGFDLAVGTLALYANVYSAQEALEPMRRAADAYDQAGDPVRAYFACYMVFQLNVRAQVPFDRAGVLARMTALARPGWSSVLLRFLRGARAYDLRLAGDATGYLDSCRRELALCRSIGAVAEGWVAAQGLMLAEQDVGHAADAVEIGAAAIDEIRAAGRLRQHPIFIALWSTMLAESGLTDRTRVALAEALPVLRSAGSPWMAHVALAWLATHEGRDADAATMLGRHLAALQDGSASGAGAYIARSLQGLDDRLASRLGAEAFERGRDAGKVLDDAQAEGIALAGVA